MIHDDILALVGRTPLLRLKPQPGQVAAVAAKLESFNPGGSVKDRIALDDLRRRVYAELELVHDSKPDFEI